mgnify:FL=1
MTGSLSVRGEVLPIGGVTAKIEAAAKSGIERIIIPHSNLQDVMIDDQWKEKVEIIAVSSLDQVMELSLMKNDKKGGLVKRLGDVVDKLTQDPKSTFS